MSIKKNKNVDEIKMLIAETNRRLGIIYKGGGKKKLEKLSDQGKLTARERVKLLLDLHTRSFEIGAFSAEGMYENYGGAPAAGVVVVMGKVKDRMCIIVANDPTVKAGAWFPMTAKKKSSCPGIGDGKQNTDSLFSRFSRRILAHAR